MEVPVSEAKAQLTELVRRAEAGEEIVLTRHGKPAVRLSSVTPPVDLEARRRLLLDLSAEMALEAVPGPDAAHAADFLFDENGMPD